MTFARWYAVTTQPRHEKVVAQQLAAKSIETFLPLLTLPRQWKDRKALIERPIFPSYVFTRIDLKDRHHVFSVPSVLRMLSFNGTPSAIDEAEIAAVRLSLSSDQRPEPHPYLKSGELVRVKSGSLQGLEGIVTRNKGQCRIVVSISLLQQSIATEIDACLLEPIGASSSNDPQETSFQRSP
jgi:transcription antitermination factor NusG